ncbi:hypothetical protein BJG93_35390 [Paraburkholderia sprentiae WSM5005]|uniref:Uncharacterized protein n=1 Tax=Paraburkholderia sprentiae WSM5005 TaxID=754502 RepID=A0A8F4QJK7_9BURK|nr:hypothetical protein [Paraburkholderia sprentiae]QXE07141.1 hypothetical protein BJG93_35390 [Paraburkholderia sprentiae WSM5005]
MSFTPESIHTMIGSWAASRRRVCHRNRIYGRKRVLKGAAQAPVAQRRESDRVDIEYRNAGTRQVNNPASRRTARIAARRAPRLQLKLAEIDDFHHDFRNIRFPPHRSTL